MSRWNVAAFVAPLFIVAFAILRSVMPDKGTEQQLFEGVISKLSSSSRIKPIPCSEGLTEFVHKDESVRCFDFTSHQGAEADVDQRLVEFQKAIQESLPRSAVMDLPWREDYGSSVAGWSLSGRPGWSWTVGFTSHGAAKQGSYDPGFWKHPENVPHFEGDVVYIALLRTSSRTEVESKQ